MAEAGIIKRDPLKESISLELDMINILCVLRMHRYMILFTDNLTR
jgi:hypothetical protein